MHVKQFAPQVQSATRRIVLLLAHHSAVSVMILITQGALLSALNRKRLAKTNNF